MPHLTLEYSANLAGEESIGQLCTSLALASTRSARTNNASIRSAASACAPCAASSTALPTARADAAFLHANLKIAAGRSDAAKKATGDALFEADQTALRR